MTHPGSFPGDPAGHRQGGQPYLPPDAYGYPPHDYGGPPPPAYYAPPPAYSPYPPMPQGSYPQAPPHPGQDPRYATPYGFPHGNPYPPAYPVAPATNGLAIGSLVGSLVGIPAYLVCLPFVGSIVGVVLGIVALNQIKHRHQKGKEMAIAGIAIGGLCLAGALIVLLVHSSAFFSH